MAAPAFGANVDVDISIDSIDTRLTAKLLLDSDTNSDPWPQLVHSIVTFDIPDVVVVNGQPRFGGKRGAKIASRIGAFTTRQLLGPINPQNINLADAIRWRPNLSDLDPPQANGPRLWWPIGSSRAQGQPVQEMDSIVPTTTDTSGRGNYGPASAYIDPNYVYSGFYGQMKLPAMVFKGNSVNVIRPTTTDPNTGSPTVDYPQVTFAATVIFHPSRQPYYGLFESTSGSNGKPLVLRYTHGLLSIFYADERVVNHETVKPANYPMVIVLALDTTTGMGRFMAIDQTRTSEQFSIAGVDVVSMRGIVGALGQGAGSSPWRYGSDLDLLELDIWPTALDFPAMESAANQLALAYGVI